MSSDRGRSDTGQDDTLEKLAHSPESVQPRIDTTKAEAREELNNKRKEWRAWFNENDINIKYMVTLYWN